MYANINIGYIIIFFLIVSLIIYLKTNKNLKGLAGEKIILLFSKIFLDKNNYHIFENIYIKHNNDITQIDQIIVSKYGIFVIEIKNFKGWIFGKANDKYWTQKIYKNSYKFQNPILQNYKHIKMLSEFLGIDKSKIFSIIVFTGDAIFKTKKPENVFEGLNYINYIKSKNIQVLSKEEVNDIINKLNNIKSQDIKKMKKEHLSKLKNQLIK